MYGGRVFRNGSLYLYLSLACQHVVLYMKNITSWLVDGCVLLWEIAEFGVPQLCLTLFIIAYATMAINVLVYSAD